MVGVTGFRSLAARVLRGFLALLIPLAVFLTAIVVAASAAVVWLDAVALPWAARRIGLPLIAMEVVVLAMSGAGGWLLGGVVGAAIGGAVWLAVIVLRRLVSALADGVATEVRGPPRRRKGATSPKEAAELTRVPLLGVAIDVSASMRDSIRGENGAELDRLGALVVAMRQVGAHDAELWGDAASVVAERGSTADVFVYAFGLKSTGRSASAFAGEWFRQFGSTSSKDMERSQWLSALQALGRAAQTPSPSEVADVLGLASVLMAPPAAPLTAPDRSSNTEQILRELKKLAAQYEIYNLVPLVESLVRGKPEAVRRLVESLRADPAAADRLSRLLQKTDITAGTPVVGRSLATWSATRPSDDLREAIALLRKLAGVSDPRTEELTLSVAEVAALLGAWHADQQLVSSMIYGRTPMCLALEVIGDRFRRERSRRPPDTPSALLVVSDGEATDGDPRTRAETLRNAGIQIFCGLLADRDLLPPQVLPISPADDWPPGARVMFDIASPLDPHSSLAKLLQSRGWLVQPGARLLLQINHSQVLAELIRIATLSTGRQSSGMQRDG